MMRTTMSLGHDLDAAAGAECGSISVIAQSSSSGTEWLVGVIVVVFLAVSMH